MVESLSSSETTKEDILSEPELVLLCLDHLKESAYDDTTTSINTETTNTTKALDRNFLTVACWALNRALATNNNGANTTKNISFPSLSEMEKELNGAEEDEKKENVLVDEFGDTSSGAGEHSGLRFYENAGVGERMLRLPEIAAAGLSALGGRTRAAAEADMVKSVLFEQYLDAVKTKGFFEENNIDEPYEFRYRKVVTKFRHKLLAKAESAGEVAPSSEPPPSARSSRRILVKEELTPTSTGLPKVLNQSDLEQAEKLKTLGNTHMQKKEYEQAAECYMDALKISPSGPNSHVYFSNRAAALVSLKQFDAAIVDSERALALKPDYSKAHARLGLAHFLLGNYRSAMEAYTVALKYEPDNKSSKNYLEKSAKRLAEASQRGGGAGGETPAGTTTCFSVVSEWDNKKGTPAHQRNHHHHPHQQHHGSSSNSHNTVTMEEREAEKYKVKGNSFMASRNYAEALEAYTQAIQANPAGSQSHVYFSNRAAALCYLERYQDAAQDSLKSLALFPKYGKAHARLGLSRFFMQDYAGAVAAYTKALEYDPDNAASKSYLAKAQAKLKEQQQQQQHRP